MPRSRVQRNNGGGKDNNKHSINCWWFAGGGRWQGANSQPIAKTSSTEVATPHIGSKQFERQHQRQCRSSMSEEISPPPPLLLLLCGCCCGAQAHMRSVSLCESRCIYHSAVTHDHDQTRSKKTSRKSISIS